MNPIICAIDTHDFDDAVNLIREIYGLVGAIKLGLEFFIAFGMDGVRRIVNLFPEIKIFLDLKFHDIPNTVSGALQSVILIKNVFLTTIHATGGAEMIKRASDIVRNANSDLKIVCVTKLTSLELVEGDVIDLTKLSLENGASGVVCPPNMSKVLRDKFGGIYNNFIIVTPGIRLEQGNVNDDDQKSIATPRSAIQSGSSYLVVGRPITQAHNKQEVIKKILSDINF